MCWWAKLTEQPGHGWALPSLPRRVRFVRLWVDSNDAGKRKSTAHLPARLFPSCKAAVGHKPRFRPARGLLRNACTFCARNQCRVRLLPPLPSPAPPVLLDIPVAHDEPSRAGLAASGQSGGPAPGAARPRWVQPAVSAASQTAKVFGMFWTEMLSLEPGWGKNFGRERLD